MQLELKDTIRVSLGLITSLTILTVTFALSSNALATTRNILDDPTNFDPEASFMVTTQAGMGREGEGTLGTEFIFDARLSRDPEKTQLRYKWDFDGDGKYDTPFTIEPIVTRTFWKKGVYTVKLAVRDEDFNFDHVIKDIRIVANTTPTPFFTVEPTSGSPAQEFKFDATDSFDDQYKEGLLQYRWDFNGDGVYDTDWSRKDFVEYTYGYGVSGIQKVTIQVKDPENARSTYSREIEILSNTVPVAVVDVDPKVGMFDTIFRLNASKSFDDETEFKDLKFRWDSDYNGPNDIIYDTNFQKYAYQKSIRYDDDNQKVGIQKVRLEVQDEDGKTATSIAYITLHWASPYLKILNDERIIFTKYDRYFNPDVPVPRGEVIKMTLKKFGVDTFRKEHVDIFSDVNVSNINAKYITEAYKLGLIEGYPDGTFRPDAPISRAETLAFILRAFEIDRLSGGRQIFPDVPQGEWFFDYVDTGTVYQLVSGYEDGRFGPHDPITFGEIAKILFQAGELEEIN